MANCSDYAVAVEAMSGGTNKVIFDDVGLPSIMVAFPKLKYSDVFTGELATDETLPAFIVGDVEKDVVWVSKYQNVVVNNRAYSLPRREASTKINLTSAFEKCRCKGVGWVLMPNSVWAAIALWCKRNGTEPNGANYYGKDYSATHEKCIPAYKLATPPYTVYRALEGSGTANWYHDNTYNGIYGLQGNINGWCSGARLNNGEINIIPNSDVFLSTVSMDASDENWKAVMPDGTFVSPNTEGTLKYDYSDTPTTNASFLLSTDILYSQNDDTSFGNKPFSLITEKSGINVPAILKSLCLFPDNAESVKGKATIKNNGERLLMRGGHWSSSSSAGVFNFDFSQLRTYNSNSLGFRSAYCE